VVFVATWTIWLASTRENREPFRWAFCLALGVLIPYFRELTWRPLTKTAAVIAKYSYGIYLSHSTVFAFALTFENPWLRWPLMAGLVVLVPVLLFHLVEDPMIQIGKRAATWRPVALGNRRLAWLRS
jgi:peptidoglycan/LPS O-acetylase OafA/YrhL